MKWGCEGVVLNASGGQRAAALWNPRLFTLNGPCLVRRVRFASKRQKKNIIRFLEMASPPRATAAPDARKPNYPGFPKGEALWPPEA
jgi:hypothetical protein